MSKGKWSWSYEYGPVTNRLLNMEKGYNYTNDTYGNMVSMPHLGTMEWDYKGNSRIQLTNATGLIFVTCSNFS